MTRPQKILELPTSRPHWDSRDPRSELSYLGWGLRSYGRHPTRPASNVDWGYHIILQGTPTLLLEHGPHRLAPNQVIVVAPRRQYQID